MFLRIFFASSLFISSVAFSADPTLSEVETQQKLEAMNAAAAKAVAAADAERSAYGTVISTYGTSIAKTAGADWSSATNALSSLMTRVRASVSSAISPGTSADAAIDAASNKILKENLEDASRAQAKAEEAKLKADGKVTAALEASKTAFNATTSMIASSAGAVNSALMDKQKEMAADTRLKAFGVQSDMASFTSVFRDLNEAKTLLERKLDKSIMASYMQAKMTKLLNSDVFCQAASATTCQKGKNTSSFKTSDLKSIFPIDATSTSSKSPTAADINAKARN